VTTHEFVTNFSDIKQGRVQASIWSQKCFRNFWYS